MNNVATVLKNARKQRDLSLAEVAKKTGIPATTINGWERGAYYPRGKHRDIIAKFYQLPKEALDYTAFNPDTDSRAFNIGQITQDIAMSEYETRAIMLHKKHWEMAKSIQERDNDVDLNQMFARVIAQVHAAK